MRLALFRSRIQVLFNKNNKQGDPQKPITLDYDDSDTGKSPAKEEDFCNDNGIRIEKIGNY